MSILIEPYQELLIQGLEEKWKSLGYIPKVTNETLDEVINERLQLSTKGGLMKVKYTGEKPYYATCGAAGADLKSSENVTIKPNDQCMVHTNTALSIPDGFFGMVTPRSSICNKFGLQLVDSVGIIDSDYRGDIMLCYKNTSDELVVIPKGERIGQIVVIPYVNCEWVQVDTLDDTERGSGGFGSTGKS